MPFPKQFRLRKTVLVGTVLIGVAVLLGLFVVHSLRSAARAAQANRVGIFAELNLGYVPLAPCAVEENDPPININVGACFPKVDEFIGFILNPPPTDANYSADKIDTFFLPEGTSVATENQKVRARISQFGNTGLQVIPEVATAGSGSVVVRAVDEVGHVALYGVRLAK